MRDIEVCDDAHYRREKLTFIVLSTWLHLHPCSSRQTTSTPRTQINDNWEKVLLNQCMFMLHRYPDEILIPFVCQSTIVGLILYTNGYSLIYLNPKSSPRVCNVSDQFPSFVMN